MDRDRAAGYFAGMPPRCFVAMPFNPTFQDRYADEFRPAIEAAGLEAYKVDDDHGADRVIEDIEREIAAAAVVLVDITDDNPNVWYELGFSQALRKPLVLVSCSNERGKDFPFDIRSRSVIVYQSNSRKGLEKLRKDVTERIKKRLTDKPEPPTPPPSIDEQALATPEVQRILKADPNRPPTASDVLAAIRAIGGLAGGGAATPTKQSVAERLRAMPEVRELLTGARPSAADSRGSGFQPSAHSFPGVNPVFIETAVNWLRTNGRTERYPVRAFGDHLGFPRGEERAVLEAAASVLGLSVAFEGAGSGERFTMVDPARLIPLTGPDGKPITLPDFMPRVSPEHVLLAEMWLEEHHQQAGTFAEMSSATGVPISSARAAIEGAAKKLGREYQFPNGRDFLRVR